MTPEFDFSYILEKIREAPFSCAPFRHVAIDEFFQPEHFEAIVSAAEIAPPTATNDSELLSGLYARGFKIINFPGCTPSPRKYIDWHERGKNVPYHTACEGFGMALRLYAFSTPILRDLNAFFAGSDFNAVVAQKLGLNPVDCSIDCGLQKYLDGYEISPHPDIRKKAATYMININPDPASETLDYHTHYLKLVPSRSYVQKFWEHNPEIDRAWVPWDWAVSEFRQTRNNSIVLFAPANDTLHAVRADYDHLRTQRTQFYGNLWYRNSPSATTVQWEELDLTRLRDQKTARTRNFRQALLGLIPTRLRTADRQTPPTYDVGPRNLE